MGMERARRIGRESYEAETQMDALNAALAEANTVFWLTLTITKGELAEHLGCSLKELEDQDYIGGIRDFGEVTKLEEIDPA